MSETGTGTTEDVVVRNVAIGIGSASLVVLLLVIIAFTLQERSHRRLGKRRRSGR